MCGLSVPPLETLPAGQVLAKMAPFEQRHDKGRPYTIEHLWGTDEMPEFL
jgi:hypothetical protein